MSDHRRIQDIRETVEKNESYKLTDVDEFKKNGQLQDAIMFNIIIIGEASNHLSDEFKENYIEIPWGAELTCPYPVKTPSLRFHSLKLKIRSLASNPTYLRYLVLLSDNKVCPYLSQQTIPLCIIAATVLVICFYKHTL